MVPWYYNLSCFFYAEKLVKAGEKNYCLLTRCAPLHFNNTLAFICILPIVKGSHPHRDFHRRHDEQLIKFLCTKTTQFTSKIYLISNPQLNPITSLNYTASTLHI